MHVHLFCQSREAHLAAQETVCFFQLVGCFEQSKYFGGNLDGAERLAPAENALQRASRAMRPCIDAPVRRRRHGREAEIAAPQLLSESQQRRILRSHNVSCPRPTASPI